MCTMTGGIISAIGAYQNAEDNRQVAKFQAAQEAENARLAQKEAEAIGVMGYQELLQVRQKMQAQKSAGRTGYASSGVVIGSGTALDYEADIADAYDSDIRNLEYDIASRKWQKQVAAANHLEQERVYLLQKENARRSKTTSLLSGLFGAFGGGIQDMKAAKGLW